MAWKPDYVTDSELKAYLRVNDAVDDAQLALAITAASRAIDQHCNRQFGNVAAQERFYTARYDRRRCRWVVDIDDLMSMAGLVVKVDGTTVTNANVTLEPINAAAESKPWTLLVFKPEAERLPTGKDHEVAITAPWGWTAVPVPVEQATLLQASRFHARRDSPYGVAGSPDAGSELRLLARVDPDVAVSLRDYIRWWGSA